VARHVGDLVRGFDLENLTLTGTIGRALERYAETLKPWAEAVGNRMVAEVAARDERSWFRVAEQMGNALRKEIAEAPIGQVMRARQDEQVRLITSLPREAAERVHAMTREGITKGWRADQISAEIMKTGEVTKSRADLIARTEVGRTSTLLTQARAEHVGSEGYNWRTAGDSDVRPSHKAMNGKFVLWTAPPTLDGLTGHAGAVPNCRCFPEPVLPD
jgi:SPP1 gp7 family putative phage head morphogenesis protein